MERGRQFVSLPVILCILALPCYRANAAAFPEPAAQERKQQPKSESTEKVSALTGCVDEQDGHYVLVDDRNLSPIVRLEADGFPPESFAKHMGHKVTVRGISSSAGTVPTFRVRSVEKVSDVCAPNK